MMKKLISMFLTLTILAGMICIYPVSAETNDVVYSSIDLSPYATGKFWIDSDDNTEEYRTYTDGLFHTNNRRVIAQWPLQLRGGNQRPDDAYPAQNAIVHSGSVAKITSTKTGITYTLPPKAAAADSKEAILLNGGYNWLPNSQTITVDGNYSAMNFLVATAAKNGASTTIAAEVSYTDGTKEQLPATAIPVAHKNGQAADNFVADINRWASEGTNAYSVQFAINDPENLIIALYEYSLSLDSNKTVSAITFTHSGYASAAIAGVTMTVASAPKILFTQHDLSAAANGKFWNDNSVDVTQYTKVDGLYGQWWHKTTYPPSLRDASSKAIISGDDTSGYTMTSTTSGVPYKMPAKTATIGEKEAIVLNGSYSGSWGLGDITSKTVMLNSGSYSKLHFLVATAQRSSHDTTSKITAEVTYTNGESVKLENAVVPKADLTSQAAAANFVADTPCRSADGPNQEFKNMYSDGYRYAFYEYSLELDPTKEVSTVKFTHSGYASTAIVSVVTEKIYSDLNLNAGNISITSKVKYTNENEKEIYQVMGNDTVNVSFDAANVSSQASDLYVYASVFDEGDRFMATDLTKVTLPTNSIDSYIVPVTIPDVDFDYANIFILDDNLRPCYRKQTLTKNDNYTMINLKDSANGKFYIDPNNESELLLSTYNNTSNKNGATDFAWHTDGPDSKVAAIYPPSLTSGTAVLNEETGLLYSESGVKYALPQRYDSVSEKEAISLSFWYSGDIDVDIDNDVYSKIHFIAASALYKEAKFQVVINYTDGSCDTSDEITAPTHSASKENLIGTMAKKDTVNSQSFVNSYIRLSLYEYSVNANPNKVVDSITFTCVDPSTFTTSTTAGGRTFMIPSITAEKLSTEQLKTFVETKIATSTSLEEESDALYKLIECLEKRSISTSEISGYDSLSPSTNACKTLYVATNGSDADGLGTIDAPFETITRACEYINASSDYLGSWKVVLRGGRYTLNESIEFNEQTLGAYPSILFTSYDNETAIISGSQKIDMAKATAVPDSIKQRLPEAAADKVVQIDLEAQGITGISHPSAANYSKTRNAYSQIIIDDTAYNVARWPNTEYAVIDKCLNNGTDGNGLSFTIRNDSAVSPNTQNWSHAETALLNGFFSDNDWRMDIIEFDTFNTATNSVVSAANPGVTMGNMTYPRRFFIENLLEEIDVPGEWYIDSNNILYLYPVNDNSEVYISTFDDALIKVSRINNIHFENLVFNGNVGSAITFNKVKNSEVKNCTIKNISTNAVSFSKCMNSGIVGSDLSYIGNTGVSIYESNYTNMRSNNVYVTDNKIEKFATLARNGKGTAITATHPIGTKISHNKISDAPWIAILMDDPINVTIEYNDISDVQQDYGDAGAIYSGQSFISQGNKIKYNYIHDVHPYSANINGYLAGIYIDDLGCGFDIYGNVINRVPIGILLGGGKNLTVSNNIIMHNDVEKAIYTINADDRGLNWAANASKTYAQELSTFIVKYPLHAQNFTHITGKYYSSEYSGYPANNSLTNNFFYKAKNGTNGIYSVYSNSDYNNSISGNYSYSTLSDSLYGSPFVDEANNNFTIKENSVITKRIPGFEPIPFENIGLLTDR